MASKLSKARELYRRARVYRDLFGFDGLSLFRESRRPTDELLRTNYRGLPVYLRKGSTDLKLFRSIFREKEYLIDLEWPPRTIVDCGANSGLSVLYYRSLFPEARIVAIEPEPGNFELLKRNTEALDNIDLVQAGVWNRSTHLEVVPGETGHWSFQTREVTTPTDHSVPAVSLADLRRTHSIDQIDLLKIDIEGAERTIFDSSAHHWLPHVATLVIEQHDRFIPDCSKILFRALDAYDYVLDFRGECLIVRFLHPWVRTRVRAQTGRMRGRTH